MDHLRQVQQARLAVHEREHDDAEGLPQRGMLEQEVDDALAAGRRGAAR